MNASSPNGVDANQATFPCSRTPAPYTIIPRFHQANQVLEPPEDLPELVTNDPAQCLALMSLSTFDLTSATAFDATPGAMRDELVAMRSVVTIAAIPRVAIRA